ncbi:MAG: hypothetical protein Q9197_003585 [Variospora fuerteventurae]
MLHKKTVMLVALLIAPIATLALPKAVVGAAAVPRSSKPETYSGVYLNRYEESDVAQKREAEADADAASKVTYGGVYLNRYEESAEKEKREAEAEAEGKATYGGVYLNRYEETVEKE